MRYHGQAYELTDPVRRAAGGRGRRERAGSASSPRSTRTHERVYGHHSDDEPTQFVNLRVEGIGTVPRGAWRERIAAAPRARPAAAGVRPRARAGWTRRSSTAAGCGRARSYPGPLVVEQLDTTVWIPPGDVARVRRSTATSSWRWRSDPRAADAALDPITREVVANSLMSAAEEMSRALRRSAYSAIIYDMLDYSCAIFGPRRRADQPGREPARAARRDVVRHAPTCCASSPTSRSDPGDVFIMNHPYHGATHSNDLIVITPMYYGDRLMGYRRHQRAPHGRRRQDAGERGRGRDRDLAGGPAAAHRQALRRRRAQPGPPRRDRRQRPRAQGDARRHPRPDRRLPDRRAALRRDLRALRRRRAARATSRTCGLHRGGGARRRSAPCGRASTAPRASWTRTSTATALLRLEVTVTVGDDGIHADFTGTDAADPRQPELPARVHRLGDLVRGAAA